MKRLYKMTFIWREHFDAREHTSGEICLQAKTFADAMKRAHSVAKQYVLGDIFLRVRSLEDVGVIR